MNEKDEQICPVCRQKKPCYCGRPPIFKLEDKDWVISETKRYLQSCVEEVAPNGVVVQANLPSLAGLAVFFGTSSQNLTNFGEKCQEFLNILDDLKTFQERRLTEGGITGRYNSTIVKLLLTKHGYSDKQQTELDIKSVSLSKLFDESKKADKTTE